MSTIIQSLEKEQLKRRPRFIAGDRLRVHFQVIEGTRTRTQVFEGVVIKRQGSGVRETFTVRKQSFGVGVERTFPLHSPKIERLEVAAHGDVRRAKLYYLRDRVGKAARVAERRWGIADEVIADRRRGRGRRRRDDPGGGAAGGSGPGGSDRERGRRRRAGPGRGRGSGRGGAPTPTRLSRGEEESQDVAEDSGEPAEAEAGEPEGGSEEDEKPAADA